MTEYELLAEGAKRGLLPPEEQALYEAAVSRGLITPDGKLVEKRINPEAKPKAVPDFPKTDEPSTTLAGPGLTEEETAATNMGGRYTSVDDLKSAIERSIGPGAGKQDIGARIRESEPSTPGGAFGATVRSASRSMIPMLSAIPGAATGARTGGALGMLGGPFAEVTGPAGALVGAIIGGASGYGAGLQGQGELLERMPYWLQEKLGWSPIQERLDTERHPIATAVGQGLTGLVGGRPTTQLGPTALSAILSGGSEAIRQAYSGETPSLQRIGALTGVGALTGKPWAANTAAFGAPEEALTLAARESVQPGGRGALSEVGVEARPVDVLDEGITSRLARRTGAAEPDTSGMFRKYNEEVRGPSGTQAAGARATGEISPEAPGVTGAALRTEAEGTVSAARRGITPQVDELGQPASAFAERLKTEANAAKGAMDQAYDEAAIAKEPATVQLSRDDGETVGNWKRMTPQEEKYYRQRFDDLGVPYTEGETHYMRIVSGGAPEVATARGIGPTTVGEFNAALREAISDYTVVPDQIAPVLKALERLEQPQMSSLTSTDIFSLRRELSQIERAVPGTPAAAAAGKARRALDGLVDRLDVAGRFSGNTQAVSKTRDAILKARDYYSNYVNDPTVAALVENDPGRARGLLFGSLTDKSPTGITNLKAARDRLGAGSPEWEAMRKDAQAQILGPDEAKTGSRWDKWSRENPTLRDLLFTAQEQEAFPVAAQTAKEAEGLFGALKLGGNLPNILSPDFASAVANLAPRERRAALVAWRDAATKAVGTSEGAESFLSALRTDARLRENVEALMGPEAAATLIRRATALVNRSSRATLAAGESTAAARGAGGVDEMPTAANAAERATRGLTVLGPALRWLEGRGMSREEAVQVTQEMLDPAKTDEVMARIQKMYGEGPARAFMRRVNAIVSGSSLLGSLPRRTVQPTATYVGGTPGPSPTPPPDVPAPQITELDDKAPEDREKELGDFFGMPPEDTPAAGAATKRFNNPGAVMYIVQNAEGKKSKSPWTAKQPGFVGFDEKTGLAKFDTPENGAAAHEALVRNRFAGKTLDAVIERYAPPPFNTPAQRAAYKAYVGKKTGMKLDDILTPDKIPAFMQAQREFEAGDTQ
jgi:hypothetical protein